MAARFKAIQERKLREQAELNAVTDAMRQAEESRKVIAREFQERRAHDLLSQARSRMEGPMIAPEERRSAMEQVKGIGQFGLVRQYPPVGSEIPVGSGFVLPESAAPKPAVVRPAVMRPDEFRPGKRMFPKPGPSPGARYPAVMGYK
jgi:hypothetical protein